MTEDEAGAVTGLIERLAERFPHISREEISSVVAAAHARLAGAPIRTYVPLLVEHDAIDHLTSPSRRVDGGRPGAGGGPARALDGHGAGAPERASVRLRRRRSR